MRKIIFGIMLIVSICIIHIECFSTDNIINPLESLGTNDINNMDFLRKYEVKNIKNCEEIDNCKFIYSKEIMFHHTKYHIYVYDFNDEECLKEFVDKNDIYIDGNISNMVNYSYFPVFSTYGTAIFIYHNKYMKIKFWSNPYVTERFVKLINKNFDRRNVV